MIDRARAMAAALPLAACVVFAMFAAPAAAQWLDLGTPREPELGERSALASIGRALEREMGALAVEPVEDELDGAAAEAKRAWRALALSLLEAGGRMGGAGRVVTDGCLRIVRELGALDALAEYASGEGRVDDAERARVLVALRASVRAAGRVEPGAIVEWGALDAALRDVFLPLTPLPGAWSEREPRASWPLWAERDVSVEGEALRGLIDGAALSEEARAGAHALVAVLALAESSPAHRATAREDASALRGALGAARSFDALPWRDEARAALWASEIDESLRGASSGERMGAVQERLERAAAAGALAREVALAAGAGVEARPLRALHHALDELLRTGGAEAVRVSGAAREALRDAAARRASIREAVGGGPAPEPWRAMAQEGARIEAALLRELTEAAWAPSRFEQPSVVSALVNHRAAREGTARLSRVRRWSQELAELGGDDARAVIRTLGALLDAHAPDATRAWAVRRLERFERVWTARVAMTDDERARWLRAWATAEGPSDEDGARLQFAIDARGAVDALLGDAAQASLRAWSALALEPAAVRAHALALRSRLSGGGRITDQTRDLAAAAVCLHALAAMWEGAPRPGGDDPADALGRLCAAPGRSGPLAGSRDDLAALRRWFTEAAKAHVAGDAAAADEAFAYLAPVCERLRADARRVAERR